MNKNDIRLLTCNNLYICHDDYFTVPGLTLPINTRLCLALSGVLEKEVPLSVTPAKGVEVQKMMARLIKIYV